MSSIEIPTQMNVIQLAQKMSDDLNSENIMDFVLLLISYNKDPKFHTKLIEEIFDVMVKNNMMFDPE